MKHIRYMKPNAIDVYVQERSQLKSDNIATILDAGKRWKLAKSLKEGGTAIFPHTYLKSCGQQIAAVVHGCLDSGADRILVLGVLHPLSERLMNARLLEHNRQDISNESCWGILGPGIVRDMAWQQEFSLDSFLFLFAHEVKRRGIKAPELILRYPCLANLAPESMPGIKELEAIVKDSIVVATSDLCHHGLAYGHEEEDALDLTGEASSYAKHHIQEGLNILSTQDYKTYYEHCQFTKSDSLDVGTLLAHLLGPLQGNILDLEIVDTSDLYEGEPKPSWVAASLVELSRFG